MAQQVIFNEKALKQALIPQCAGNEQLANTVGNIIVRQLEAFGVIKTVDVQPEAPKPAPKPERSTEDIVRDLLASLGPNARTAAKDGIIILGL